MSAKGGPRPPRWWYDESPVPLHARALAGVYGRAIAVRSNLYRIGALRRRRMAVPVVVIGNLVAGGAGKTPLTIAMVERLRAAGRNPGIATRGYGRTEQAPTWAEANSDPAQVGDEPLLLARSTGAKVRVDRHRVAAARALVDAGCDIVVCDDGLQHYALARDIEIEVVDGRRRHGNGRLLPAGPLREPIERAAECDFRVVNLADGQAAPGFGEWPMRLAPGDALPLRGGRPKPLNAFVGQRVHAIAGIGDPERFFGMLRGIGIAVVPHAFPDHHRYVAEDLAFGSDLPVLMTDKDAVKCEALAGERHYRVPVRAELPEAFWIAFFDRLTAVQPGQRHD